MKNLEDLINKCVDTIDTDVTRLHEAGKDRSLELPEGKLLTEYTKTLMTLSKIKELTESDVNRLGELPLEELEKKAKEILNKSKVTS